MFVYERFESLRSSLGITKSHIASELNRTPTICQDWKQGKSEPSREQLLKLSELLNTSPEYLVGETDDPARRVSPDDFSVAMHGLSKDLTLQAKLALLNMAQQLADAERNRKRENTD